MRAVRPRTRCLGAVAVILFITIVFVHYSNVSQQSEPEVRSLIDVDWKKMRRKEYSDDTLNGEAVIPRIPPPQQQKFPNAAVALPPAIRPEGNRGYEGKVEENRGDEARRAMDQQGIFLPLGAPSYPNVVKGRFIAPNRIIHLDLKGAAPKPTYFSALFPWLKKMGATGLLIEWEDMFPYEGILAPTRHGNAYSLSEVRQILGWARDSQLDVIPLVQTFGHLEWILKLPQFMKYRQAERYPQVICLADENAVQLVEEALKQVITVHREFGMPFFHIGADEAFQVGMCEADQRLLREQLNNNREKLMIRHMARIAHTTRRLAANQTRVIMWHDMLMNAPGNFISEYGLGNLVEPVVWNYAEELDNQLMPDLWTRLSASFPFVWAASAFKGADGPNRFYANIKHYQLNHESWMKQMTRNYRHFAQFRGIILTGWQRFDHFAVLCETLPVGLMSAAVNLGILKGGTWDATVLKETSQLMGCTAPINIESQYVSGYCEFPGFKVYQSVTNLRQSLMMIAEQVHNDYMIRGWISEFNIRQKYTQLWYLDQVKDKVFAFTSELQSIAKNIRAAMEPIFFPDTIDEFMMEYVEPDLEKLQKLLAEIKALGELRTFQRRPFPILLASSPLTDNAAIGAQKRLV